jgi:hypothetical protein
MLRLPVIGNKTRELIDLEFLGSLASAETRLKLPTFRQSLASARTYLSAEKGVRSINSYTLRADGELWLIQVSRKSWKCLWNFGALIS